MRLCTCKTILLNAAAACGCQDVDPVTPKPGGPKQVSSSGAGLFAPLGPPPLCSTRADAAHIGPQGVFDDNNDGIEAVTLIAEECEPFPPVEDFSLVWLQEDAIIGLGDASVVQVPLGDYTFTLAATTPDGASETLSSLVVSVVPPDTPSAVFFLNEFSFSNACIDPCAEMVTTQPDDPDGVVLVNLDGSVSSAGLEGEIARYVWSVDGVEVSIEPVVTLPLAVGEHEIELLVENDVGLIHRRIRTGVVVHRSEASQSVCPECD